MNNIALTMDDERTLKNSSPGFYANPRLLSPTFNLVGRDIGLMVLGFIIGVAVLMGLLWYRGGSNSPGVSSITSIFDFRKKPAADVDPNAGLIPAGPVQQATPFRASVLRVKVDNLTLRTCPGFDCSSVTTLPRGTSVSLLGDRQTTNDMEWVKVRAGSQDGWVSRYFLE